MPRLLIVFGGTVVALIKQAEAVLRLAIPSLGGALIPGRRSPEVTQGAATFEVQISQQPLRFRVAGVCFLLNPGARLVAHDTARACLLANDQGPSRSVSCVRGLLQQLGRALGVCRKRAPVGEHAREPEARFRVTRLPGPAVVRGGPLGVALYAVAFFVALPEFGLGVRAAKARPDARAAHLVAAKRHEQGKRKACGGEPAAKGGPVPA